MCLQKTILLMLAALLAEGFLTGCAPNRQVFQRGWIDGEFADAHTSLFASGYVKETNLMTVLPKQVKEEQSGAALVTRVFDKTPIAEAGIKEGDLIIKINNSPVTSIKNLHKIVDSLKPGSTAIVKLYRNGEMSERSITIGKESYKKYGTIVLGFGLGTKMDLIPHPEFNWFSLARFTKSADRASLYSPERKYISSVTNNVKPVTNQLWDAWLLIFGAGKYETIVSQELSAQETK